MKKVTLPAGLLFLAVIFLANLSCSTQFKTGPIAIAGQSDASASYTNNEIKRYYGKLNVRSLADVPESEYPQYKKYVSDKTVLVIVHPAYFIFFQDNNENKILVKRRNDLSKNIVDLFLDDYAADTGSILEQIQLSLKNENRFLREKSLRRELVILVLPPRYKKHPEYPYKNLDEFGRYLNEVTNGSPSLLYVESEEFKSGYLSGDTLNRLNKFFNAVEIRTIRLGGGYKNMCLKNCYDDIASIRKGQNIVMAPEICTVSPDVISR